MAGISRAGFQFSERAGQIEIVVASFDRGFDYAKLQLAFDAIRAGARLVATNPDRYCPTPGGGEPDCGAIIAAIEACTQVRCDPIVGKPSPVMSSFLLERLNLPAGHCMLLGDRLETDIRMGLEAGMRTCLVLSGDANRDRLQASGLKPDLVLERMDELLLELG